MILIPILNSVLMLQLGTGIYTYLGTKDATYANEDSDKTIKVSLTIIIIITILFTLINGLYIFDIINKKRTILNITLLAIVSSLFIFIIYVYLNVQGQSHPGYSQSKSNLEANSENTNKSVKEFNLISGIVSIVITSLLISFYIGYRFFSREIIRRVKSPYIVEKVRTKNRAKNKFRF